MIMIMMMMMIMIIIELRGLECLVYNIFGARPLPQATSS